MSAVCKVRVFGLVPHWRDDGVRVPVQFGDYAVEEISPALYQFSGGPRAETFNLTLEELSAHEAQMRVIEGIWPPLKVSGRA